MKKDVVENKPTVCSHTFSIKMHFLLVYRELSILYFSDFSPLSPARSLALSLSPLFSLVFYADYLLERHWKYMRQRQLKCLFCRLRKHEGKKD